jgi:hypothetical protein
VDSLINQDDEREQSVRITYAHALLTVLFRLLLSNVEIQYARIYSYLIVSFSRGDKGRYDEQGKEDLDGNH